MQMIAHRSRSVLNILLGQTGGRQLFRNRKAFVIGWKVFSHLVNKRYLSKISRDTIRLRPLVNHFSPSALISIQDGQQRPRHLRRRLRHRLPHPGDHQVHNRRQQSGPETAAVYDHGGAARAAGADVSAADAATATNRIRHQVPLFFRRTAV